MTKPQSLAVAVAAVLALAAADAGAQYPGGQGTSRRGGFGGPRGEAPDKSATTPSDSPASLRSRVQLLLDRLEDDLKIGAPQQKAWDDYAARVVRYADDVARERFAARDVTATSGTAVEQFDRIGRLARERATELDGVIDAGRALYATLGAEQRPIADRDLAKLVRALASGAPTPADAARAEARKQP